MQSKSECDNEKIKLKILRKDTVFRPVVAELLIFTMFSYLWSIRFDLPRNNIIYMVLVDVVVFFFIFAPSLICSLSFAELSSLCDSNVWRCMEPYVALCAINSCFEPNSKLKLIVSTISRMDEGMKEPLIKTYVYNIQPKSWACILHICIFAYVYFLYNLNSVLCVIFSISRHSIRFHSVVFAFFSFFFFFFFSFHIMPCHVHVSCHIIGIYGVSL